ncbi:MAG: FtsX-like permease family protein [Bacteroidota bacterium]
MNITSFIARRVAASGQKSFSRLIIRIAITSVALGVAVMILATALISGFKNEISSKIFGFWGHIHITDSGLNRSLLDAYPISQEQDFYPSLDTIDSVPYPVTEHWLGMEVEKIATTNGGIKHIQVFALKPGIIKVKSEIEGIILKGVGADFDWTFIQDYLQDGEVLAWQDTVANKGILLSQQTANRLRVKVGDSFIIHFPERDGNILKKRFKVSGIYKTGLEEYDSKFALVDIRQLRQLLKWRDDEISGFEVFIDDLNDLDIIADYIYYDRMPARLIAETIRDKFPEIFDWLELQDINEIVILGLMVIVAIINMITALMILILERANMIGTLKALGGSNWAIQKIFLYYAGNIILYGLFWGNLIGLGLGFLQDQFGIIQLSEADYYLSVAPVHFDLWSILGINIGTLTIILIFLIVPSFLVTSISPVKAIRFK